MNLLVETSENRKENERLLEKDAVFHMKIIRSTLSLLELLIFIGEPFQDQIQSDMFPDINIDGKTENLDYLSDGKRFY